MERYLFEVAAIRTAATRSAVLVPLRRPADFKPVLHYPPAPTAPACSNTWAQRARDI